MICRPRLFNDICLCFDLNIDQIGKLHSKNTYTVLPRFNANIGTLPFLGIMAGWHYREGGDLGLWI